MRDPKNYSKMLGYETMLSANSKGLYRSIIHVLYYIVCVCGRLWTLDFAPYRQ